LTLDAAGRSDQAVLAEAAAAVCDVRGDDAALRRLADLPADRRGAAFDRLRAEYPVRREFRFTTVRCAGADRSLLGKLAGLGFRLAEGAE
jgi:erythronate-4-phosphate dehydrogenase